jgi:hypothetical protein
MQPRTSSQLEFPAIAGPSKTAGIDPARATPISAVLKISGSLGRTSRVAQILRDGDYLLLNQRD